MTDHAYGLDVLRSAERAVAGKLGEMLREGRDPRAHCVMVAPAKGLPGVPEAAPGEALFAVVIFTRAAARGLFLSYGREDIASTIAGHDTRAGFGLVVVSWPEGTQLHEVELPVLARGGSA